MIVSLDSGDNYYLHARWKKAKAMPKLKVCQQARKGGRGAGCRPWIAPAGLHPSRWSAL